MSTRAFLLLCICTYFGCAGKKQEEPRAKAAAVSAEQVKIDISLGNGNASIIGDELMWDAFHEKMSLKGNVSLVINEPVSLRASAGGVTIRQSANVIELSGNVRAWFGIGKHEKQKSSNAPFKL